MEAIFADDLTGACDVAASAGQIAWIPLATGRSHHTAEVLVFSLETREMPPAEARTTVRAALAAIRLPVRYWKMDSLLRGNWAHELAEALERGAVKRRLLVAPAFPEQNRTTVAGVQYAHGAPVAEYLGSGDSSIKAQLVAAGVPAARFRVENARTPEELRSVAESLMGDETPVGSAGLARALWKPLRAGPERIAGSVLVVVGTASRRGREQIERLRRSGGVRVIEPADQATLMGRVEEAVRIALPEALVVAGGETLRGMARRLDFDDLLVMGEVEPGVALARICGGTLDGRQVITKAGDFGDRDVLARAVERFGAG